MSSDVRDKNSGLEDRVIKIRRCAAVVKGGRRFSFNALVVVGDKRGQVGWGYGKANEVPPAVEKAIKDAQGNMLKVNLKGSTIPHRIMGKYGATKVVLIPAGPGTGVKAGQGVREVLELAGIQNILTKVHGSTNSANVVKATMAGLRMLRTKEQVEALRGVKI
jgi:small subunit ribosomal protein S5